jgi:hypothetical protein
VAFVVMPLMPLAPATPLMLQPPNVWLEFVSVAWPGGVGLLPAVAERLELVHVTTWPLLLWLTNVALPLRAPLSESPLTTAGPLALPTVRIALAAEAVSGTTASAAAIATAIARYQYLRMGQ